MKTMYRAVGNRCAVCLSSLNIPLPYEEILILLIRHGFDMHDVDLVALARQCIGTSKYRRGARIHEAPAVVDCSSFVKWLYGMRGIWLPRRSLDQRECGHVVSPSKIQAGDLVFTKGTFGWYYDDPTDDVGHVGMATGEGTVIHACDSKVHIIETPYEQFVGTLKARGIRRYIPTDAEVLTVGVPKKLDIETSNDLRWLILQSLPY